jgi:hypothetical protein
MQSVGREVITDSYGCRNFSILLIVLSNKLPNLLVKVVEEPVFLYPSFKQWLYIS